MNIGMENIGDVAVIALKSDISSNKRFNTMMAPVLAKCDKLIFDMEQVRLIDSFGCGNLLACLRKLKISGGELKLCSVQKPVRTLFELMRIHRIIEMFDTREEAVVSFLN